MNLPVFLATLGQRPEAITMALDVLYPRYQFTEICILHTDPDQSDIAEAYHALQDELKVYDGCCITYREIMLADGSSMLDISNRSEGEVYYRGVVDILRGYRLTFQPIHLLVAGGRKAMSIYATLAAAVLFGENDKVWTFHAPPEIRIPGLFHAPAGTQDSVQTIELPVQYSNLIPYEIARRDVDDLIQQQSPRQRFLANLTPTEKTIIETLAQHPYASNDDLSEILARSARTIENHLGRTYGKLMQHFDLKIEDKRKRQVLIDVISGRV